MNSYQKGYLAGVRAAISIIKTEELVRQRFDLSNTMSPNRVIEEHLRVLNAHADVLAREYNILTGAEPAEDGLK